MNAITGTARVNRDKSFRYYLQRLTLSYENVILMFMIFSLFCAVSRHNLGYVCIDYSPITSARCLLQWSGLWKRLRVKLKVAL